MSSKRRVSKNQLSTNHKLLRESIELEMCMMVYFSSSVKKVEKVKRCKSVKTEVFLENYSLIDSNVF